MVDSKLKRFLKLVPAVMKLFYGLMRHPKVPAWLKVAAVAGIVYFFSPLDIVPDFITGVGFVDDVIVTFLIMQMFIANVKPEVLREVAAKSRVNLDDIAVDVEDGILFLQGSYRALFDFIKENRDTILKTFGGRRFRLTIQAEPAPEIEEEQFPST